MIALHAMRSSACSIPRNCSITCHLPVSASAWPRPHRRSHGSRLARPPCAAARADTVPVWETLVVVNTPSGVPQSAEEQKELLDTLWSLQYRTPGACCASAGPVVQAASRDASTTARAAVYYRFSSQAQAERFIAGPAFGDAKARLLGSGAVSLSLWRVLVPNDMEALFKRGPSFEMGVDLILVLEPPPAASGEPQPPLPTDVVVELVGRLQAAALAANSVQVSCGADLMSLETKYVWMARFPQEDGAQRFLRSPIVSELSSALGAAEQAGAPAGPLVLSSVAVVEVGAVDQSKQRL